MSAGANAHALTLTRLLDAPRERVWRAWTEPRHLGRWSAPRGFRVPLCEGDLYSGGRWASTLVSPDGFEHRLVGRYREVEPPERLAFSHAWLDATGHAGPETLVVVTLEERGAGTLLSLTQSGFATATARDAHREGWAECLDRLAEHLAEA